MWEDILGEEVKEGVCWTKRRMTMGRRLQPRSTVLDLHDKHIITMH